MKLKTIILASLISFAFIFTYISCGGGGGGGGSSDSSASVKLNGVLAPEDYQVAQAEPKSFFVRLFSPVQSAYATYADEFVDKIIAVPVLNGEIDGTQMSASVSATIDSDGAFSLSLSRKYDWVLVLMDTTAVETEEKFVGYIALKATDTESLLSLPLIDATVTWIDIGTVTRNGRLGVGGNAPKPAYFSMTAEELLTLAINDDIFKAAQNLALNYKDAIYYALRPDFVWNGDYTSTDNAFVNVSAYEYKQYEFTLDSNMMGLTMDGICANDVPRVNLEFYPPALTNISASNGNNIYNIDTPMSNKDATCAPAADGTVWATGTDFFAVPDENGIEYGGITLEFGIEIIGSIPDGYWTYKVDGDVKGVFDAAVASPLTAENKIRGFVPSIKVNTDESGKVTSVDVKWYYFNTGTGSYVELTDISLLKHLVGSGDIYFDNSSGAERRYESIHFVPATETSVTPVNTWYYGTDGLAAERAEGIGIAYSAAGTGYFFHFFRP